MINQTEVHQFSNGYEVRSESVLSQQDRFNVDMRDPGVNEKFGADNRSDLYSRNRGVEMLPECILINPDCRAEPKDELKNADRRLSKAETSVEDALKESHRQPPDYREIRNCIKEAQRELNKGEKDLRQSLRESLGENFSKREIDEMLKERLSGKSFSRKADEILDAMAQVKEAKRQLREAGALVKELSLPWNRHDDLKIDLLRTNLKFGRTEIEQAIRDVRDADRPNNRRVDIFKAI